jgi:hypothetical protein
MFAKSWSERTGAVTCERMAQRVFTLHRLIPPTGVPGVVRRAGSRDIELLHGGELISLTRRPVDCAATAAPGNRSSTAWKRETPRCWGESMGSPVAWASATAPIVAMSRIGRCRRCRGIAGTDTAVQLPRPPRAGRWRTAPST